MTGPETRFRDEYFSKAFRLMWDATRLPCSALFTVKFCMQVSGRL